MYFRISEIPHCVPNFYKNPHGNFRNMLEIYDLKGYPMEDKLIYIPNTEK